MNGATRVRGFTIEDVRREWDALAPLRWEQILSGADVTFNEVLLPAIESLIPPGSEEMIALDVGCGIGASTKALAHHFKAIDAIDPSGVSIGLAKKLAGGVARDIEECSVEKFASSTKRKYNVIVANMVLMDVPDLNTFLSAVKIMLRPGGCFIYTTTHPFFWPQYYGYADESWFQYLETAFVRAPFKISADRTNQLQSTHVHRPLSAYFSALKMARLRTDVLLEPTPTPAIEARYSQPWRFPRYLAVRCRKIKLVGSSAAR
jgi:2-polyprenyl-3-methyl-5-hydroxy-6-metoxy-1,4-benzoquinol methylase